MTHGLYSPWNSPGKNTGAGSLSLLHGIFPTRASNPGLPHCRQIPYQLSHKESPRTLEWVAYSFSSGSSHPRNGTRISCIAGRFFTNWVISEAQKNVQIRSDQITSVTQSCPTLRDPMKRSTPGLPVHHQLPEFTQTHVHRVGDAIQPSHPLSSPSPLAPNPSQHQSLFQWVNSSHEVAKVLEFQL